jgi:hypothetical protein
MSNILFECSIYTLELRTDQRARKAIHVPRTSDHMNTIIMIMVFCIHHLTRNTCARSETMKMSCLDKSKCFLFRRFATVCAAAVMKIKCVFHTKEIKNDSPARIGFAQIAFFPRYFLPIVRLGTDHFVINTNFRIEGPELRKAEEKNKSRITRADRYYYSVKFERALLA